MCRLRKTLFFVTKSHSLNLNSVWCLFSTCPLISLPSLPVKSHREHFTLGLIEASGPFRPRVFFGLWFVWRGGGTMPLSTSIRSTWFWSSSIAGTSAPASGSRGLTRLSIEDKDHSRMQECEVGGDIHPT